MNIVGILLLSTLLLSGCLGQIRPKGDSGENGIANIVTTVHGSAPPIVLPTDMPATQTKPPATKAPTIQKLNVTGPIRSLHDYLEDPAWNSACEQTCLQTKKLAREVFCSLGGGDYFTSFQNELGLKESDLLDENTEKIQQYQDRCAKITPEVVFDCAAFQKGILSCSNGLKGCQNGGFWLQFNRTQVLMETGYDVDPLIFVNSTAFKDRLERKGCPE